MDRSQRASRDRDVGIFAKLNVKFTPKGTVTHLKVQNQIMLICLDGQRLQFIKLQTNEENNVSLSLAPHDRIAHVHLDPTGNHALISSSGGENYYLSIKSKGVKALKRLKNHVITAVGWNVELSKDFDTSFIVLGTSKGVMMETTISSGSISYLKTLTNSPDKEKGQSPITSLHLSQCSEYGSDGADGRWMILVGLQGRLCCLSGMINPIARETTAQQVVGTMLSAAMLDQTVATLQPLFKEKPRCFTLPSEQNVQLSLCAIHPEARNETPNKYVWLNACGVAIGNFDPSRVDASASDGYDILQEEVTLPHKMVDGKVDLPMDVALTEHHVLLLYADRFVAVSLLNQKVMHEELLTNESYHIVGMTRDSASQFIWIYTESSILKYRPVDETKFIWKIYMDRGEYTKAMKLTHRMKDQKPHQLVLKKLAEKQIAEKKYEAAAQTLKGSTEPFESIVLKLLSAGVDARNGLKLFLELKLREIEVVNSVDRMRRDVLVLWLMELFLNEMAKAKRTSSDIPLGRESPERVAQQEASISQLRDQLFVFLNNRAVREAIETNREAIYQMMTTHADYESKLRLAKSLKDYTTEVDIQIHMQEYSEALKVICQQGDPHLFYQYSPLLFPHIPRELFMAWIRNDRIVPSLLVPTLYKCHASAEMREAAMQYIRVALQKKDRKGVDKQTHNFYVSLLAKYKPNKLLPYFESYGTVRKDVPYDVEFALRLCLENDNEREGNLSRCCVFLYCVAGMFEQAVDRALPIDLNLAKECVKMMDQCHDDDQALSFPLPEIGQRPQKYSSEMKRRIWLKIARYVITERKDVAACMDLLKESNNILKIQDLLPHFPEFTKIEHFKEPLCSSLKDHSVKIQALQKEMKDAADMANDIRADMDKLKTRFTIIKPSDKCEKCKEKALTRPFFAFSCKHFYHRDCLELAIQPTFTQEEAKDFRSLKSKLAKCKRPQRPSDVNNAEFREWAVVNKELDRLMSESCILCGPKMIKSVVRPLLTAEEYDKEMETW